MTANSTIGAAAAVFIFAIRTATTRADDRSAVAAVSLIDLPEDKLALKQTMAGVLSYVGLARALRFAPRRQVG